jgi:hypothetical protein
MKDAQKPTQPKGASALGCIQADAAYPYEEFQKLTGQGRTAMRSFRMQGLRVIRAGNRRYILGRDWLAFLESLANSKSDDQENEN